MKDDTVSLVKFRSLKRLLGLSEWQVIGLLESLWLFARKNARLGDVGRFTNDEIAGAIEYAGDADALVGVLVATKWIDEAPTDARLVIHDWLDNAPDFIVRYVGKSLGMAENRTATAELKAVWHAKMFGRENAENAPRRGAKTPETRPAGAQKRQKSAPSRARALTQPNQTQPPPPSPSVANPSAPDPEPLADEWAEVVVVVRDCGVGDAEAACTQARDLGATTTEVLNICRHYQEHPGAWTPGLLYSILRRINPGAKVSWPAPANGYQPPAYRAVTPDEFRQFVTDQRFRDGPHRNTSNPRWVFGTLRDGAKVECKDFPAPAKASAT